MYRITPADHMSTAPLSYPLFFRISGATYPGVPHAVFIMSPAVSIRASPKSATLRLASSAGEA